MFTNYSYERVRVTEINDVYTDAASAGSATRSCATRCSSARTASASSARSSPSLVYNTVDQPIFPTSGKRFTSSIDLAGLGGNTNFYKPMVEGVWFLRQSRRLSLGMRGQAEYIHSFSGSKELPIFEKLFLGGEYSIRGFDIRTVGPQDPVTGLVLGGNKSLLFNIEEQITIAGPVRLIAVLRCGPGAGGANAWSCRRSSCRSADRSAARIDAWQELQLRRTSRRRPALEVRFFMPVLNVPFRLIFAYNPQREGVLRQQLPARRRRSSSGLPSARPSSEPV